MTPDLQRLHQCFDQLSAIVDSLDLELVDDPQWIEPSDTSYLNDSDQADPDIMANVEAMAATNKLIAWFGRDHEGFVGLWRGAEDQPLDRAPVVRLDSEGQYNIVAATIPDYLAISMPEEEFESSRQVLVAAGFKVTASDTEIWEALNDAESPNDFRYALYNEERVRRGLPQI
ncbi:hypothetical protein ACIGHN_26925 [Acidovorax sp. NPDC077693]|uniref:hypothetical protein n=1 Tax=unclassified Acidovorax TaxID=2684926 RepID=UPI0037C5411F